MGEALKPGGLYQTASGEWKDANGNIVDAPSKPKKQAQPPVNETEGDGGIVTAAPDAPDLPDDEAEQTEQTAKKGRK